MFLKLTFVNATSFRRPGEGDGGGELVGPWRPLRPLNSWKGGRDDPLGKIRSTQDVGNLPGTAGAPPRLPLPHRQLGVPAALQRDHHMHVCLLPDRLCQTVCGQSNRLHSHQRYSGGNYLLGPTRSNIDNNFIVSLCYSKIAYPNRLEVSPRNCCLLNFKDLLSCP